MTDVDGLDDIVRDFVAESLEGLEQYERDLIALEQRPDSPELLDQIFRVVHTVKGTCGFLPFRRLEALTHAGENLLTALRRHELSPTAEVTDVLLALADGIRSLLQHIGDTGSEGPDSVTDLIERLQSLHVAGTAPGSVAGADRQPVGDPTADQGMAPAQTGGDPGPEPEPEPPAAVRAAESKVRVDVALLDRMMGLVGELVLARNQLSQRTSAGDDADLRHLSQRLRAISTDLQEEVMQARLQPIDTVWNKLPRVVRDLSGQLGKSVRLDVQGGETELDRAILEAIKDPMTHAVRNAIDHGIEEPDRRVGTGKPATGRLALRAYHQSGLVNVQISDDGAGMDPEGLRRTAVARGLLTADEAARLGDKESLELVFRPGFSTADRVSNVSGRGVGMDVVRTNVERVGGVIEVDSVPGQGTTLHIRIPLTLAILPALVVRAHGQRYAVPQVHVQELVQPGAAAETARIEFAHDAPVYRLRGHLLPLVDLRTQLHLPPRADQPGIIVVLHATGGSVGLVVDAVLGTEEVVVKPLGRQLRDIPLYAGATTMGDGGVALILDVPAVASRAGLGTDAPDTTGATPSGRPDGSDVTDPAVSTGPETVRLLLLALADGGRAALPLSAVRRLERIPVGSVDRVGEAYVVSYRGGVLPLVHAEPVLAARQAGRPGAAEEETALTVIVCRLEEVTVGLVVGEILDIVDGEPLAGAPGSDGRPTGPVVVRDHLTSLLDLDDVLLEVDPRLLTVTTTAEALR